MCNDDEKVCYNLVINLSQPDIINFFLIFIEVCHFYSNIKFKMNKMKKKLLVESLDFSNKIFRMLF